MSGTEITENNVVMTTSHEGELISEALWFFTYARVPARDYETTCKDWVIVSVGDDRGGVTIRGDSHVAKYRRLGVLGIDRAAHSPVGSVVTIKR